MQQLTTLQDVHNHITDHLLKQGKPAILSEGELSPPQCRYRGPEGTSCAVGCLISDENYKIELEGAGVEHSTRGYHIMNAVKSSINWEGSDIDLTNLLSDWQDAHDNFNGATNLKLEKRPWDVYIKEHAERIAELYGLNP